MAGEAPALLERSEELEALSGAAAAARAGPGGRLVLIAGEAGIGKTAAAPLSASSSSERSKIGRAHV